jgi:hypothetical protein
MNVATIASRGSATALAGDSTPGDRSVLVEITVSPGRDSPVRSESNQNSPERVVGVSVSEIELSIEPSSP